MSANNDTTKDKKRRGKEPLSNEKQKVTNSFDKWLNAPTNTYLLNSLIEDLTFYELRYRLNAEEQ